LEITAHAGESLRQLTSKACRNGESSPSAADLYVEVLALVCDDG
jgi:hypothetical protein